MDRIIDNSARVCGYDPATVDQFLDAAAEERARLLAALDAANARIAAAREHLQAEWDLRDQMGSVVIQAGRRRLQLEANANAAVTELLAAADAEAEACLAAARAELARRKLEAAVRHSGEHEAGRVVPPDQPATDTDRTDGNVIDLSAHRVLEVG